MIYKDLDIRLLVLEMAYCDRPQVITDRFVSYEDTDNGRWGELNVHPPVCWQGYAAALKGRFVSYPFDNWEKHLDWANIIILNFEYDHKLPLKIIDKIRKSGKKVISCWKENGARLYQELCINPNKINEILDVYNESDYVMHYPQDTITKYWPIKNKIRLYFPYPYDIKEIRDQYANIKNKDGILIGMRPHRNAEINKGFWENLAQALSTSALETMSCPKIKVIVVNKDNATIGAIKKYCGNREVEFIDYIHNYYDWLNLLAKSELVFNNDRSLTQGRVTAESELVGTRCIDTWTDYGDLKNRYRDGIKFWADWSATREKIRRVLLGLNHKTVDDIRMIVTQ